MMIGVGDYRTTPDILVNVADALGHNRLSYGKWTAEAEKRWADIHKVKHAIGVTSGTAALHVAVLAAAEIHHWRPGAEILVPAVTFVATANVVTLSGFKPVFVDVSPETALMDPVAARRAITPNTVAMIPVHLFGQAAPMNVLVDIADAMDLVVIEDSCEAFAATHFGRPVGGIGDMAAFSTYVAHHIPAGIGGFLTTNDDDYAAISRSLVNHGRDMSYWNIDMRQPGAAEYQFLFHRAGLNYRTTELVSAVQCGLLDQWQYFARRRQTIAKIYTTRLAPLEYSGLGVTETQFGNEHSWMMFPVLAEWANDDPQRKFEFMEYLYENGIDTREALPLIKQPYLGLDPAAYENAAYWDRCGLYLPCHQYMSEDEADYICDVITTYVEKLR